MKVVLLFVSFFTFWFYEAPKGMIAFFASFNKAFLQLFSLGLSVRTFFKPLKNEYREGLVGFSLALGIFFKSFFILFDLAVFSVLLSLEAIVLVCFLLWPAATALVLFL